MTRAIRWTTTGVVAGCFLLAAMEPSARADESAWRIVRTLEIGPTWAGHPVGFDLLTTGGRQFVAYYDQDRQLTIADRALADDSWRLTRLDSRVGWDSHNSLVLAVDRDGQLHLSGNMHVRPLIYFRTTRPLDPTSFEGLNRMVGTEETRCTYPRFFNGPDNELIFSYRDGSSGNGNTLYNIYDPDARSWRRLLDEPLLDGEGERNAYPNGPTRGPDGWFHLLWVWRETPDCATNHDLSYARSRDLKRWETIAGESLELPITLASGDIVDRVEVGGGLLNGGNALGWDRDQRPVISYYKYDAQGNTQAYTARFEQGRWVSVQASQWTTRWDFQGGGSIGKEVAVGAVSPGPNGTLRVPYSHNQEGSGVLVLDETTRALIRVEPPVPSDLPGAVTRLESTFPGMQVQRQEGSGPDGVCYVLRWETLGPNRDRPREGPLPGPTTLRLLELKRPAT